MHELKIHPPSTPGGPIHLNIGNCDKDGAIVAARLASAMGGVSMTRPLEIKPDRYTDHSYFADIANALALYYRMIPDSPLLSTQTVVLCSIHPAALYIAEVLHAPLLPMQLLSFSQSLKQAQTSQTLSIVGADHDAGFLWQWNKIDKVSQFPMGYVDMIRHADDLVLVRSTDAGDGCPIEGRIGDIFVNNTLRKLNPALWRDIKPFIEDRDSDYSKLRHWEWGLPDDSVSAAKALWKSLGKKNDNFHLIEAQTIDLFKHIPAIWEQYLAHNQAKTRGITLNEYWTAHPCYERYAGLVPIHYYSFAELRETARGYLQKYGSKQALPGSICAFTNNAGSRSNAKDVQTLLMELSIENNCWFSNGFDCPDAECVDIFGNKIPKPYEKVAEWINEAPYRSNQWEPLDINCVSESIT